MDLQNTFQFLIDLECNNYRPWFNENKARYLVAKESIDQLVEELIPLIQSFDKEVDVTSAKECVYRIYRDARFTKDQAPYKTHFGAFISKGGRKSPYAGYYFHFEADRSLVGGGIYRPESAVLKAIRTHIYQSPRDYKDIIHQADFQTTFTEIYSDPLKTAPKGFPKDWKDIALIKNKSYIVSQQMDNDFWFKDNVAKRLSQIFQQQHHFNQFLNKAVTASLKGNS